VLRGQGSHLTWNLLYYLPFSVVSIGLFFGPDNGSDVFPETPVGPQKNTRLCVPEEITA
jgi:hypothetical protein